MPEATPLKRCNVCGSLKIVGDFYRGHGICKVCHKKADSRRWKKRYRSDPQFREKCIQYARAHHARRKAEDPRYVELVSIRKRICEARNRAERLIEQQIENDKHLMKLIKERDRLVGELKAK